MSLNAQEVEHFLKLACEEACKNVIENEGRPFGAVVVKNGEIIARGRSQASKLTDPTAHAEVRAIREAATKLGSISLKDCTLFSSSYPCPMCFGACLWSELDKVYYACTLEDAAKAGFQDARLYSIIVDEEKRGKFASRVPVDGATNAFKIWEEKEKEKC